MKITLKSFLIVFVLLQCQIATSQNKKSVFDGYVGVLVNHYAYTYTLQNIKHLVAYLDSVNYNKVVVFSYYKSYPNLKNYCKNKAKFKYLPIMINQIPDAFKLPQPNTCAGFMLFDDTNSIFIKFSGLSFKEMITKVQQFINKKSKTNLFHPTTIPSYNIYYQSSSGNIISGIYFDELDNILDLNKERLITYNISTRLLKINYLNDATKQDILVDIHTRLDKILSKLSEEQSDYSKEVMDSIMTYANLPRSFQIKWEVVNNTIILNSSYYICKIKDGNPENMLLSQRSAWFSYHIDSDSLHVLKFPFLLETILYDQIFSGCDSNILYLTDKNYIYKSKLNPLQNIANVAAKLKIEAKNFAYTYIDFWQKKLIISDAIHDSLFIKEYNLQTLALSNKRTYVIKGFDIRNIILGTATKSHFYFVVNSYNKVSGYALISISKTSFQVNHKKLFIPNFIDFPRIYLFKDNLLVSFSNAVGNRTLLQLHLE